MKLEHAVLRSEVKQTFTQIKRSLNRIARQPGQVMDHTGTPAREETRGVDNIGTNASLCQGPKTLHVLWEEWTKGIAGMKPARLFTYHERGQSKFVFSKRKVFWKKVSEMVRAGMLAEVAIDKIYKVDGEGQAVTKILREMQKDKARGGHPELQT